MTMHEQTIRDFNRGDIDILYRFRFGSQDSWTGWRSFRTALKQQPGTVWPWDFPGNTEVEWKTKRTTTRNPNGSLP